MGIPHSESPIREGNISSVPDEVNGDLSFANELLCSNWSLIDKLGSPT